MLTYVAAAAVGMLGASYAAVPLYRLYCQVGEVQSGVVRCRTDSGGCLRLSPKEEARSGCDLPKVTKEVSGKAAGGSPRPHSDQVCTTLQSEIP